MTYYYAKNVIWSALDSENKVTATFDIMDEEGNLLFQGQEVRDTLDVVQDKIVEVVKNVKARLKAEAQEREIAVELYDEIVKNSEFKIEIE